MDPRDRADFDAWPEGWDWDALEGYLRRLEDGACSITPLADPNPMSTAFVEAAAQAGVAGPSELRPEGLEGAGLLRVTQRRGLRCTAADNYLKPARRRPNLTVLTDSQALRVELEDGRAVGVRYRDASDEEAVAEATREVILCAGAIGSPQLLMLSGIGPAGALGELGIEVVRDLPEVGEGLADHCMAIALFDAHGSESLYTAQSPRQLARLLLRRRGMLTSNVGEAAACVRSRPEFDAPDLELIFAPVLYMEEGLLPPPRHGFSIASVALQPRSRASVRLRSADPLDPPLIDPAFLEDPDDVLALVHGVKLARRIAGTAPLARWLSDERAPGEEARTDQQIEAWIRGNAHTIYHPVATCALGRVVDGELRVRGVGGLRVADASVIPRLMRGHSHAATTMLAERAADMVTGRLPAAAGTGL